MIPITVLTGFLGAGKSTLVSELLRIAGGSKQGPRLALISNEFAAASESACSCAEELEHLPAVGVRIFETVDGCLCCTAAGSGERPSQAFARILAKLQQEFRGRFDRVIVETTGLIGDFEFLSKLDGQPFFLDGIVAVVSAVPQAVALKLDSNERTLVNQLAVADAIVMSKLDLVTPEKAAAREQWIRRVNPDAPVYRATRGQLEGFNAQQTLRSLLMISDTRQQPKQAKQQQQQQPKSPKDFLPRVYGLPRLRTGQAEHDPTLETLALASLPHLSNGGSSSGSGRTSLAQIQAAVEAYIRAHRRDILRIKGVFTDPDTGDAWLLQGVGGAHSWTPLLPALEPADASEAEADPFVVFRENNGYDLGDGDSAAAAPAESSLRQRKSAKAVKKESSGSAPGAAAEERRADRLLVIGHMVQLHTGYLREHLPHLVPLRTARPAPQSLNLITVLVIVLVVILTTWLSKSSAEQS